MFERNRIGVFSEQMIQINLMPVEDRIWRIVPHPRNHSVLVKRVWERCNIGAYGGTDLCWAGWRVDWQHIASFLMYIHSHTNNWYTTLCVSQPPIDKSWLFQIFDIYLMSFVTQMLPYLPGFVLFCFVAAHIQLYINRGWLKLKYRKIQLTFFSQYLFLMFKKGRASLLQD